MCGGEWLDRLSARCTLIGNHENENAVLENRIRVSEMPRSVGIVCDVLVFTQMYELNMTMSAWPEAVAARGRPVSVCGGQ